MRRRKVIISQKAWTALKDYIVYLKENVSEETANYVRKGILDKCEQLSEFVGYSKEQYLDDHPVEYRSVTQWNYNIIYRVTEKEVRVLKIIHTSQHPNKRKNI